MVGKIIFLLILDIIYVLPNKTRWMNEVASTVEKKLDFSGQSPSGL